MASLPDAKQQGLTIIGVLIAAMLLVAGVVATAQLVARTNRVSGVAQEKFIATNLAREGLELVRAQRDTNWFKGNGWADQLCGIFTIESDSNGAIFIRSNPTAAQQQLYITNQDLWTHLSGGSSTPSRYSRVVTIVPHAFDFDVSTKIGDESRFVSCGDADVAVLDVTSKVSWTDRDTPQEVTVKEKLYDWYNPN